MNSEHLPPGEWAGQLSDWCDKYQVNYHNAPLMRGLGSECYELDSCPCCGDKHPAVFVLNGEPFYQCGCKSTFEDVAWELAVKQSGGSTTKAGVEFATLGIAAEACQAIGITVPVDEQLRGRLAVVKNNGTLTIEVEKGKGDSRPPGWNGTDKKTRWTFVAANEPNESEESESDGVSLLISFTKSGELFHSPAGEAFATVQVKDHCETYRIKSADFRRWLNYQYYQLTGSAPSSKTLAEAVNAIEAIANYDGAEREVFCRLGKVGDKLYLDLGNDKWEVVEIDADGWRVVACPAHVKFRRAKGQLSLPRPEPGNINELRPFVNVTDESWVLLVGGLVAAIRYPGPYFIILILAGHGGAKTTVMKFVRSLVDPNDAPVRTPPRDEHSLLLAGMNGLFVCLDNVSACQSGY